MYLESLSDLEDMIEEQIGYLQSWRETVEEAQQMQETIEAIREVVGDIGDMIEIHIRPPQPEVQSEAMVSSFESSNEIIVDESVEDNEVKSEIGP